MKATRNTDKPLPTGHEPASDPEFNDELPASRIDPDASEFRDEIQVGNYASVGALTSEMESERQEAEMATLDALEAMRAMEAGDQIKWRIARSGHENDELNGFLETWPNHLMTIERLRDRFGGGTYYCRGFRRGKYFAHKTLQISGEAKRKPSGVEGVNNSVPVAPAGSGFDVQGFLIAQERRDERRAAQERQERQEREEREEKRRQERMQLLLTLGPAAIGALGGLFQGRPDNTAALISALKPPDPLTLLTQLKALSGSGQDGLISKMLPMLFDMASSKATGGDTGWLDVIKEFAKGAGPAVGGLIEAQLKAAQAMPPLSVEVSAAQAPSTGPSNPMLSSGMRAGGAPFAPVPPHGESGLPNTSNGTIVVPDSVRRRERRSATAQGNSAAGHPMPQPGSRQAGFAATAGSSSPSNGNADMNVMSLLPHLPWLRDVLGRMLQGAARGKSPQVYAALFLEEIPDDVSGETVLQLLGAPDWFASICKLIPQWNDSRLYPWLDAARTEILTTIHRSMGVPPGAAHGVSAPHVSQDPTPAAAPPPRRPTDEIDRPTKLPSLTGD